ncbi:hypothetical protein B0H14DRAFT_2642405 [Mycena olivaceomarginata]|nr:hypothetical protein B0H14DRAFT_2642405 [Mycena olivaceomarginata]
MDANPAAHFTLPPNLTDGQFFVQMLWLPHTHTTRSGKVFSPHYAPLPPLVTALQREDFDFVPLIVRAVASECDNQEDHKDGDDFDDVDDEWPLRADDGGGIDNAWPTPQPWAPDDVDEDSPTPATSKRHSHPPYPEIHHIPPPDYLVGYLLPLKKHRHSSPNLAQVLATALEPQTGAHRSFKRAKFGPSCVEWQERYEGRKPPPRW